MKSDGQDAKKLASLLKRLQKTHGQVDTPAQLKPIDRLVRSFLQWESTTHKAAQAHEQLQAAMVDHNELRVSHWHEIVDVIGRDYPNAQERATLLRQVLQEIYLHERAVSLQGLSGKPKKQVRAYLENLPGIPTYVTAQVMLLAFGGHAIPVDESLTQLLRNEGVVESDATVEKTQSFLERQIKADRSVEMHLLLQAWVDSKSTHTTKSRTRRSSAVIAVTVGRAGATGTSGSSEASGVSGVSGASGVSGKTSSGKKASKKKVVKKTAGKTSVTKK